MKFRTEIDIAPLGCKIGYGSRILTVGSCFADNMAAALAHARFNITANPTGVMFNPASIARTLRMFGSEMQVQPEELAHGGERYFDFRFHGSLADATAEGAAAKINTALRLGHEALSAASHVIITFGTAWVYELAATGEIAANCHKQPAAMFNRRRLGTEEIVADYSDLLEKLLKDKDVILTVSPVRHLSDGFEQNSLSKAVLRLAAEELVQRYDNVHYFPAYEIMNDDLRDYRFYADDMAHPSPRAVEYIREKFVAAAIEPHAAEFMPRAERIVSAAEHRPANPLSDEYAAFCRRMLEEAARAEAIQPEADFSAEKEFFAGQLKAKTAAEDAKNL